MRHRTERWAKLAIRGRFKMEAKARIGAVDYFKISAPKIDRSLMSSPLSVGNCTSATLSLSILTDDEIKSTSPVVIMGRLTDGKTYSEWKEFGTFYINQRDTSYEGLLTIDCFDAMLKTNQDYLDDSDSTANWPKTMKAVVEEVAYRIGVGIDRRTKINTGADYTVPYPTGKTMMQVLGYIGACHGGNWIITEENLLRLVPLVTAPDETFHIISHDYEKIKTNDGYLLAHKEQTVFNAVLPEPTGETPESVVPVTHHITDEYGNAVITAEDHYLAWAINGSADSVDGLINIPVVCGQITTGTQVTITGVTMNDDEGNSYTTGDNSGSTLAIESNPYSTQGICDDLYAAFSGLVYFPYTATKALYDPATELGDQVKIGDMVHSVLYSSTLDFDLNFRADISAPNSAELSEEYPHLSEIKKLKQTTKQLNGAIDNAAKALSDKVDDAALQEEINRARGVEIELSNLIGTEETRAKEAESGLSTKLVALNETVNNHDAKLLGLEQAVGEHGESIEVIQKNVSGLEDRLTSAEGKTANIEGSLADILQRLSALEGNTSGGSTENI